MIIALIVVAALVAFYFVAKLLTKKPKTEVKSPVYVPTPSVTPKPGALGISDSSGPNACAFGGILNVSEYSFEGGNSLCSCESVSIPATSNLPTGHYFISDGNNSRAFKKSQYSIIFTQEASCKICQ